MMPQLYATDQALKATNMYVSRHFSNVGWQFRNRKASLESTNDRVILEDNKDDEDMEVSALDRPRAQPDISENVVCLIDPYQRSSLSLIRCADAERNANWWFL
jgi:hypothetical protein